MIFFIIFISLFLNITATNDKELWTQFKKEHFKMYRSLREEKLRFDIFKSTLDIINDHNAKYHAGTESFYMGINQFSDITDEEFQKLYVNTKVPITEPRAQLKQNNGSVPEAIDWREKGAVLSIRNQGFHCGSCWAFSAIAAIEGQNAIKHKVKLELSEQELIDCSDEYGNDGCFGGWMNYAFSYIQDNGISTEKEYSYQEENLKCRKYINKSAVIVTGYKDINNNEEDLKKAVATIGPISVALNGNPIRHYAGGIYNNMLCPKILNHGVVVIGYGTANNSEYWLIKNSWGVHWGEEGFIRMSRNKQNQCGIASAPSYPILA